MKKWSLGIILLFPFLGIGQEWQPNFEEAQIQAAQEGKPLILVFSGSDWCAPCIKLDKDIWQSNTFKEHALKHYILYKADFPKKRKNQLSPEVVVKNKELAERYNPEGYFPLVLVLDKDSGVLGTIGYRRYGPEKYVQLLDSFLQ